MTARAPAQMLAVLVGLAFVTLGVLGFVPGVTRDYGDLTFAGRDSGADLFGLFQVSILHNLVHLATGLVGLAMARTIDGARVFLIGGGVVYIALWIYGLAIGTESSANFVPIDDAGDWLHLGLAVTMIVGGLATARARMAPATPTTPPPA